MNTGKKPKTFLCIDAGTTRFKTAVISSFGTIIAKKDYYYKDPLSRNFRFHYYRQKDFYEAFKLTIENIKKEFNLKKISAIGVTGHGQTLVPIGKEILPIYESFGFLDDRLYSYVEIVKKYMKDDAVSLMYIPLALYFKNELPSIYRHTYSFLTPSDYISFLLTKKFFTSVSSPTIEPWKLESLEKFGLDTSKFPKFIYMGQKIGNTTLKAKNLFDIPEGIPVFAMGGDFAMGELGTGTVEYGKAYLRFGTSAGINICWDKNITDRRVLSYKHFIQGLWNISAIINTAGISIDWAKRILKIKETPKLLEKSSKNILFFPYLKGEKTPLWNPNITASIIGIKDGIDKIDILFSILLGIIMGLKEGIEIIEEHGASFNKPIVTSGWWAGINWFLQMIADITGKKYATIQNSDAELLGIAVVLSKAIGVYPDLKTGVKTIVKTKKIFKPDLARTDYYNRFYEKYKHIRDKLYTKTMSTHNLFDNTNLIL